MHSDLIDPRHYNQFACQPRDVAADWWGHGRPAAFLGFALSHMLGYMARLGCKGADAGSYPSDVTDLDRILIDLRKVANWNDYLIRYVETLREARNNRESV